MARTLPCFSPFYVIKLFRSDSGSVVFSAFPCFLPPLRHRMPGFFFRREGTRFFLSTPPFPFPLAWPHPRRVEEIRKGIVLLASHVCFLALHTRASTNFPSLFLSLPPYWRSTDSVVQVRLHPPVLFLLVTIAAVASSFLRFLPS